MNKPLSRALLVGLLFVFVYYGVRLMIQVSQGIYLTMNYVPDIVEEYESVAYLQHNVSFGFVYRSISVWRTAGEIFGFLLLGIVVYYIRQRLKR